MRCPVRPHRQRLATGILSSVVAVGLVGLIVGCAWALPQNPTHEGNTSAACHSTKSGQTPSCHESDHHLDRRAILPPVAILPGSCDILKRGSDSGGSSSAFHTTSPLFHQLPDHERPSLDSLSSRSSVRIHLLHEVFLN